MNSEYSASEETIKLVSSLRQGSVLHVPTIPFLSTKSDPLHYAARQQVSRISTDQDSSSVGLNPMISAVTIPTQKVVLISQTCELQEVRTKKGDSLVQVAPVVELQETESKQALNGSRPRFVPIPWHGERLFADLSHVAAVDRGLIARAKEYSAPSAEIDRRRFSYLVGRYYSRPAIPDAIVDALRPLQHKITKAKNKSLKKVYESVLSIRVFPRPEYGDSDENHLDIYFIIDPDWYPEVEPEAPANDCKELHEIAERIVGYVEARVEGDYKFLVYFWKLFLDSLRLHLERAYLEVDDRSVSGFSLIPVVSLGPVEYENSDPLDLGYLSDQSNPS